MSKWCKNQTTGILLTFIRSMMHQYSRRSIIPALLLLLIAGWNCHPAPYAATNKSYKKQAKAYAKQISQVPPADSAAVAPWVGTTNFNLRKPNYVVIHHTAQKSCDQTLKTFTLTRTQVSAHYVICKDGTLHHMLNDYFRAWHGGVARWGNNTDINSSSIGIEIDNDGFEPFTDPQITTLIDLLGRLKRAYSIPIANFIGHADIAPTRKNDPNVNFPWKKLADSGFGVWWTDTTSVSVPPDFNNLLALRLIGYDTRNPQAVIQTFKRKYEQIETKDSVLSDADRKVLYALYKKFE
jgi:N-acetylmuramoyl-L-alanine amidase